MVRAGLGWAGQGAALLGQCCSRSRLPPHCMHGRRRAVCAGEQRLCLPQPPRCSGLPSPEVISGGNPGLPAARRRLTSPERAHSTAIRSGGRPSWAPRPAPAWLPPIPDTCRCTALHTTLPVCLSPAAPAAPAAHPADAKSTHALLPPSHTLPAAPSPQARPHWTRRAARRSRRLSWLGLGPKPRRAPAWPPSSASAWPRNKRSATSGRCRRASRVRRVWGLGAVLCLQRLPSPPCELRPRAPRAPDPQPA